MTLSRREFIQGAAAMGATLALGRTRPRVASHLARAARPLSRGRRLGRSGSAAA